MGHRGERATGAGPPAPLVTERLELVAFEPAAIRALLAGDAKGAAAAQGRRLDGALVGALDPYFLQVQLERMSAMPAGRVWCARLIVQRDDRAAIGHCGFHGPPELVGRAEIGYTVLAEFRGNGYATEAAAALLQLAVALGVAPVYASVAPGNGPSRRVLAKLGFVEAGRQSDELDGEELVLTWREPA